MLEDLAWDTLAWPPRKNTCGDADAVKGGRSVRHVQAEHGDRSRRGRIPSQQLGKHERHRALSTARLQGICQQGQIEKTCHE